MRAIVWQLNKGTENCQILVIEVDGEYVVVRGAHDAAPEEASHTRPKTFEETSRQAQEWTQYLEERGWQLTLKPFTTMLPDMQMHEPWTWWNSFRDARDEWAAEAAR